MYCARGKCCLSWWLRARGPRRRGDDVFQSFGLPTTKVERADPAEVWAPRAGPWRPLAGRSSGLGPFASRAMFTRGSRRAAVERAAGALVSGRLPGRRATAASRPEPARGSVPDLPVTWSRATPQRCGRALMRSTVGPAPGTAGCRHPRRASARDRGGDKRPRRPARSDHRASARRARPQTRIARWRRGSRGSRAVTEGTGFATRVAERSQGKRARTVRPCRREVGAARGGPTGSAAPLAAEASRRRAGEKPSTPATRPPRRAIPRRRGARSSGDPEEETRPATRHAARRGVPRSRRDAKRRPATGASHPW